MIKYNNEVIKALKKSEEEAFKNNGDLVSIDYFILGTLKTNNNIKNILNQNNITYELFKEKIKANNKSNSNILFYSIELKKLLDLSSDTASRYSSNEISLEYIYLTLLDENINIELLKELNLNLELFYKEILKSITNDNNKIIFEIGIDLTKLSKNKKLGKAVGREKQIEELIEILARKNKNNPILIGEAGVGKTAIVEELANKIVKKDVPTFLKNKKIISINIASIISGTKYRGEFEEKLTKILKECESRDDIILFIDEIHTIVGAGGAEGAIDASNILKPVLARGTIKIIGATTTNEYKTFISKDKALDRRFQRVYIDEPNSDETYNILVKIKKEYETFHNVKISDNNIKKIVELSNKYIFDRNNPDKSIDILDEACAYTNILKDNRLNNKLYQLLDKVNLKKENSIKNQDYINALKYKEKEQEIINKINTKKNNNVLLSTIIKIIESKCNSNIYDIETNRIYDYLKNGLKEKIIGQDDVIDSIVNKLKFLQNKKDDTPISMLINGPIGSGKSLIPKTLSNLTNRNLITLNMSEFNTEISINKIIGSPQGYVGYNDNNTVLEDIKLHPNSIILFENIENCHNSILNLISNVLDTGVLKNSKNEILNFKNSILIFTTNIKENNTIGYVTNNLNDNELSKQFLDKINYSFNLNKLNIFDIEKIINLELKEFNNNYELNVSLNDKDIEAIVNNSNFNKLGAKNIKKNLKEYIENYLITSNAL